MNSASYLANLKPNYLQKMKVTLMTPPMPAPGGPPMPAPPPGAPPMPGGPTINNTLNAPVQPPPPMAPPQVAQ